MNINELKEVVKDVINESTLSRLHDHISNHDCAILTAFRNDPSDSSMCADSVEAPASYQKDGLSVRDINKLNNRDLKAKLLDLNYGVTSVDGSFIENFGTELAKEVKEDSLFVVNINDVDTETFISSIQKLGIYFCQDSVLIIPKGGKGAYFLGTNKSSFPGFGETYVLGNISYGREAEFMTKVGNRPITAKLQENLQTYNKLGRLEKMAVRAIAKNVKI